MAGEHSRSSSTDERVPLWAQEVRERLVAIETKLDRYQDLQQTAYSAKALAEHNMDDIRELKTYAGENRSTATQAKALAESCTEKVAKIESGNTWLQRVVIGAVILAVLNLLFSLAGGVPPAGG